MPDEKVFVNLCYPVSRVTMIRHTFQSSRVRYIVLIKGNWPFKNSLSLSALAWWLCVRSMTQSHVQIWRYAKTRSRCVLSPAHTHPARWFMAQLAIVHKICSITRPLYTYGKQSKLKLHLRLKFENKVMSPTNVLPATVFINQSYTYNKFPK